VKSLNRISQSKVNSLTLELYYRGLATRKERKLVEKALVADSVVRKRYEDLQKSDREIQQLVEQELRRLNIPQTSCVVFPQKKKAVRLLIVAAAVLLCVLIPAILYLKSSNSNKDNVIAEEPTDEINIEDDTGFFENKSNTEIAIPSEKPTKSSEPRIEPNNSVSIATVPEPDTGIRIRGGDHVVGENQTTVTEEPSNINIPSGITFIFDNMFANNDLTFVIIPSRITSIGKNAFSGNPLVSVTIEANVSIEDNAIPGNFADFYNANGKAAGTYTRSDINSEVWEKK